jgi:hypothetical protein
MTAGSRTMEHARKLWGMGWLMWLAAFALLILFSVYSDQLFPYWAEKYPRWAHDYPREKVLPIRFLITDFMKWLVNDATFGLFTFKEMTRSISWLLDWRRPACSAPALWKARGRTPYRSRRRSPGWR